ncbi:hypothetical protein [Bavariicoccus seileri]|uniref:hypothetical protein n=1 Tax=Bavariicoccus seileri TaxID=549685 RepID=UPI003F8E6B16
MKKIVYYIGLVLLPVLGLIVNQSVYLKIQGEFMRYGQISIGGRLLLIIVPTIIIAVVLNLFYGSLVYVKDLDYKILLLVLALISILVLFLPYNQLGFLSRFNATVLFIETQLRLPVITGLYVATFIYSLVHKK